jgi:hypothetical protein
MVRVELAEALAAIARADGNTRPVKPLLALLRTCNAAGRRFLAAIAAMRIPPPFSETVAAAVIEALGTLRAYDAVGPIAGISRVNLRSYTLPQVAAAGARTLPTLIRDDTREQIAGALFVLIDNPSYGRRARFHGAIGVGERKLDTPELRKALRGALEDPRLRTERGAPALRAAAWALEQLTGEAPALPPITRQPGNWIIRSRSR